MAMNEQSMNVMPPVSTTIAPGMSETANTGASFSSRKTPALTIVEEWSRAEVGVGATIAPRSQVWNGIWAAFVMPARASSAAGRAATTGA